MIKPLCYTHRERETAPKTCDTCNRIATEQDIVTRVIDVLLAAGYSLTFDDGEGYRPLVPTKDRAALLAEAMEVDDERLRAYVGTDLKGWVYFVYGNSGYDVISDYTVNLESTLKPVNDYADTLA